MGAEKAGADVSRVSAAWEKARLMRAMSRLESAERGLESAEQGSNAEKREQAVAPVAGSRVASMRMKARQMRSWGKPDPSKCGGSAEELEHACSEAEAANVWRIAGAQKQARLIRAVDRLTSAECNGNAEKME